MACQGTSENYLTNPDQHNFRGVIIDTFFCLQKFASKAQAIVRGDK